MSCRAVSTGSERSSIGAEELRIATDGPSMESPILAVTVGFPPKPLVPQLRSVIPGQPRDSWRSQTWSGWIRESETRRSAAGSPRSPRPFGLYFTNDLRHRLGGRIRHDHHHHGWHERDDHDRPPSRWRGRPDRNGHRCRKRQYPCENDLRLRNTKGHSSCFRARREITPTGARHRNEPRPGATHSVGALVRDDRPGRYGRPRTQESRNGMPPHSTGFTGLLQLERTVCRPLRR